MSPACVRLATTARCFVAEVATGETEESDRRISPSEIGSDMEQRLAAITLGVRDIARARAFYEQGMGWGRDGGEDDVAFYQTSGMIFALYEWPKLALDAAVDQEGSGFRGVTLGYATRERDEVEMVLDRAEAAGGRVLVQARDAFWGGYNGYFADLDGHLWEVMWNPGLTITADGDHLLNLSP